MTLNLSQLNRRVAAKILGSCFLFFVCLRLNAQQVYLLHFNAGKSCIDIDTYYLYYGTNNKIVARSANSILIGLNSIILTSDSARIEKLNDSLYHLQPVYRDVRFKIFIMDILTGKKIDSVYSYSIALPLSFSINEKNYPLSYSRVILENIQSLFLAPMRRGCLDYEKDFKIASYQLVLMRKDTAVLSKCFKAGQLIDNSFKKKLMKFSKPGDGLFAKNIILESKDGRKTRVDEYGLLKVQ